MPSPAFFSPSLPCHHGRVSYAPSATLTSRSSFLGRTRLSTDDPTHERATRATRWRMALSQVVIAGGSGFVGTRLTRTLLSSGANVKVLTRRADSELPRGAERVMWKPGSGEKETWQSALERVDLVVNLAGAPVISRWTDAGRATILESRVDATRALADAITAMAPSDRPRCMASASAVGFYGVSEEGEFDESSGCGEGFLADVCRQWEREADNAECEGTRVVKVRVGVVMGARGGALARMVPAFQLFIGGPVGSGRQWVPWVHIDDLARVFVAAGENDGMRGVYNATAPNGVTMKKLADALGKALGRPSMFPVPDFVLKAVYGEAASVVLSGQHVIPKRLQDTGFEFRYADIDACLTAVAKEV